MSTARVLELLQEQNLLAAEIAIYGLSEDSAEVRRFAAIDLELERLVDEPDCSFSITTASAAA